MADEPTPNAPEQEASQEEAFDEERAKAKIRKANSEAENLRKRLKELEPLAQRAQEFEEAQKTETQRAVEAQQAAEERAVKAERDALRYRVAVDKGLRPELIDFLTGESQEDIEAKADTLLALTTPATPEVTRQPRERLRPGAVPASEPEETDPAKLAASIPRGGF
jgi:hypothetical protein